MASVTDFVYSEAKSINVKKDEQKAQEVFAAKSIAASKGKGVPAIVKEYQRQTGVNAQDRSSFGPTTLRVELYSGILSYNSAVAKVERRRASALRAVEAAERQQKTSPTFAEQYEALDKLRTNDEFAFVFPLTMVVLHEVVGEAPMYTVLLCRLDANWGTTQYSQDVAVYSAYRVFDPAAQIQNTYVNLTQRIPFIGSPQRGTPQSTYTRATMTVFPGKQIPGAGSTTTPTFLRKLQLASLSTNQFTEYVVDMYAVARFSDKRQRALIVASKTCETVV